METRRKFLKLMIEENIGNSQKRNQQGLLPEDIEHFPYIQEIEGKQSS
jgi:hypothetical protein